MTIPMVYLRSDAISDEFQVFFRIFERKLSILKNIVELIMNSSYHSWISLIVVLFSIKFLTVFNFQLL